MLKYLIIYLKNQIKIQTNFNHILKSDFFYKIENEEKNE